MNKPSSLTQLESARQGVVTEKMKQAAAAENIDAFYLANGYRVAELSVSVERSKLPKNFKSLGYEITSFYDLSWQVSLNIPASKFEPERREEIKRAFNADQANYCYEKEV